MKTIIWIASDTRNVPGLGIFEQGTEREVPDDVAVSLVAQGLAIYPDVKVPAKQKSTKQEIES